MSSDPFDDTAPHGGRGGTRTTHEGTPQRLRIFVPTGDSELVMGLNDDRHLGVRARTVATVHRKASNSMLGTLAGKSDEVSIARTGVGLGVNEQGFVGVVATADHGNVLLVATGAADVGSNYNHATRVGVIIETTINITRTALMLWSARYNAGHAATVPTVLGVAQVVWSGFNAVTSPFSGDPSSGLGNMDYMKTGHVTLFGARSVKLESIEGVSSSAALFNTHNAGLSASLNSVVVASVNSGLMASVNGAYTASVNGQTASVVGGMDAGVSSRVGHTRIEGRTVRIGNRKQAGAKAQILSGIQEATEDVWVRADDFIELAVPAADELPETPADWVMDGYLVGMHRHPVGMQIMQGSVRLNSDKASFGVGSGLLGIAGTSVMRVSKAGIQLGRVKVPPGKLTGSPLTIARTGFSFAWGASEGVVKQLGMALSTGASTKMKAALAVVGTLATGAAGAGVAAAGGAGAGAIAGGGSGEAGSDEGAQLGAITGAALGIAGMAATMSLIAMKTAGLAQRAGQALAKKAYLSALRASQTVEGTAALIDPTAPKIEVKDDCVLLSFGPPGVGSSIKLSASGVDIKAMKVTVNDMQIGPPMVPAPPAPPMMPDIPDPVIKVGGPSAEQSVLLTPGAF
jgi:hypothetical protein